MKFSNELKGTLFVLLAAVCWSINSPIVKYLTLNPFLICGLRSLIAGIALLPFLRIREIKKNRYLPLYFISYTALCLAVIISLSLTSPAIAIGMQYTASLWIFIGTVAMTRKIPWRQFLPVLIITAGVAIFMISGGSGDSNSTGNVIALSEGIFFALMTLSSKKVTDTNALGAVCLANLTTVGVVFLLFEPARLGFTAITPLDWILMLIMGVIQVAGGYGLFAMGIQTISAQKASLLALLEMILAPLWVALFIGTIPPMMVQIGLLVVLAGLLLETLGKWQLANIKEKSHEKHFNPRSRLPVKTIRIFSVFASFLHPLNPAFYRDRIRTSFLSDPYPFWAAGPSVSIFSGALSASGSPRPLMNAATVSFSSGAGIRVRGAGHSSDKGRREIIDSNK